MALRLVDGAGEWEYPFDKLELDDFPIGAGAFGEVFLGTATGHKQGSERVAVKILGPDAEDVDRKEFFGEMEVMKRLRHPNLVRLIGVCTGEGQDRPNIILEYMNRGDLRVFLQQCREKTTGKKVMRPRNQPEPDGNLPEGEKLEPEDLISFALQVAAGMAHLADLGAVHRDLACRNVLIDQNKCCKVSDFGLCNMQTEGYSRKTRDNKIAIKWTAPEGLQTDTYTSASDMWSYGVVLWEIWSLGGIPYPGIINSDVMDLVVKENYRMDMPDNCPEDISTLMKSCWQLDPEKRPTFGEISGKLMASSDMEETAF